MKTMGLIGGMSWQSSLEYYRIVNQAVAERLGGTRSCPCLMHSFDFAQIEALQHAGDWDGLAALLSGAGLGLKQAGAECLVICTNTMHLLADEVQRATDLPLVHIADAAGQELRRLGVGQAGLLGTRFTMEKDFYRRRLAEAFGIEVLVPEPGDRETVHRIIYEELVRGIVREESRAEYRRIMADLVRHGAGAVVLGCTEIPLLVGPGDASIPLLDTTRLHAEAAVRFCLEG